MSNYRFRKNTVIGNLDAETDAFLSECFFESSIYKALIKFEDDNDFTKRIIIGRTGSGKTALLKKIVGDNTIKGSGTIEAESTVFEHIINNIFISQLIEKDIDLRVFYKSLWIHVLLVKVIEMTYSDSNNFIKNLLTFNSSKKKLFNINMAKEYLNNFKDNFFNDNVVSEITDKMQEDLHGEVNAFINAGAKSSNESTKKVQSVTAQYVSKELLKKQKELIKVIKSESDSENQIRIVICIDDLDKSWLSLSEIRYDFINALLDAFKELIEIKSVKILISIRTDIIMGIYKNNLRQEEKDRSLIVPVEWNLSEIREILNYRINYLIKNHYSGCEDVKFSDIFNFEINNQRVDEYILERTMLRPRDAIDFVNSCLSGGDGSTQLNEDLVLNAEERFYESRKKALIKEWVSLYPYISDYLDCVVYFHDKNCSL